MLPLTRSLEPNDTDKGALHDPIGVLMLKSGHVALIAVVILTGCRHSNPSDADQEDGQNFANQDGVQFLTSGYDAFSGWDWIVNKSNTALGHVKEGPLKDFQHKIHHYDGDLDQIFRGGEYFCDPDDMLYVSGTNDLAYLPYLEWEKDIFISNDRQLGRITYKHDTALPFKTGLSSGHLKPNVTIKIDKSLHADTNFVDSRVYLTNEYETNVDLVYVTQDAAYMYLPDGDQESVGTMVLDNRDITLDAYHFGKLAYGDVVATYHQTQNFIAGYIVNSSAEVWGGVLPEYAFFVRHEYSDTLPGYANLDSFTPQSGEAIIDYLESISQATYTPAKLKTRMLVFHFKDVAPGETVVATYYQFGATDRSDLVRQLNDDGLTESASRIGSN